MPAYGVRSKVCVATSAESPFSAGPSGPATVLALASGVEVLPPSVDTTVYA